MPPKAKFEKVQIVEKAFEIVRTQGIAYCTARALGEALGSSTRPIFTVFKSMEEVESEVICKAKNLYASYVDKGLASEPAFKGVGTQYILFAIKEPKLFQLLFMTENSSADIGRILPIIEEHYDSILSSVKVYGLSDIVSEKLYRHLWVYTHGIAALCATKTCGFTAEQISEMMTEVFKSLLAKFREDNKKSE